MMGKQEKVVKSIGRETTQDSSHLHAMKKNPNDECYTSMESILSELSYWGDLGKFYNRSIVCPCDWDIVEGENIYSITIDFIDCRVSGNSVKKKVNSICYALFDDASGIEEVTLSPDEFDNFIRKRLTCNFLRTLTQKAAKWGIKSITASGYNPATGKGIPFQDVDFSKYDVCITNPPFSLYKEFMQSIVGKIDFVVLAPFVNRITTYVASALMTGKAYLGREIHMTLDFTNPAPENEYTTKCVCCDWLTSWPEAQIERNIHPRKTHISYADYKDEYEFMENMTMKDGTHPMIVGAGTIPDDYEGWMFGPASILDGISMDDYEWCSSELCAYFNEIHPELNPCAHPFSSKMKIHNGSKKFSGIIFRKKKGTHKTMRQKKAALKKEDSCITSVTDILPELSYWGRLGKFRGKRVICPCDWDICKNEQIFSMRAEYDDSGMLQKISYLRYSNGRNKYDEVSLTGADAKAFLDKVECNFIRTLTQNAKNWGIKSVSASGYDPETGRGFKFQDVDYSAYDVCVTNPPFSQHAEFFGTVVGNIDFIALSPLINRVNPCVCVPLMQNKMYLGKNIHLSLSFVQPDADNQYQTKPVGYDWVTSFPDAQMYRNSLHKRTGARYLPGKYTVMSTLHMKEGASPIIVSSDDMPDDYDGWMLVPGTILDKLDTGEYEFFGLHCNKYLNDNPDLSPFADRFTDAAMKYQGVNYYTRFIVRKKPKQIS